MATQIIARARGAVFPGEATRRSDTIAAIRHGAQHTHQAIGRVVVAASALIGTNDAVRYHVDRFAGSVRQT